MNILLIVYDNDSHISFFPQSIAAIASALVPKHYVKIYNQDIYHTPDENITEYLNQNN